MNIVVTIVGFGNIGKLICALLLPYKQHHFTINVVDVDESKKGAIIDFEHGKQLYPNHNLAFNSDFLLNNSDVIFHCAGAAVPRGQSRLFVCRQSIEITEAVFKDFKPVKTPFVIVVANPVEIISTITHKITGLPHSHIIGTGTFLDSIRMNHYVSKANKEVASVDAILLGEHGKTAFLSEQLSSVNGVKFRELFDDKSINQYMSLVKGAAEEIKATQEATVYGVSYCAINIFEMLLSPEGQSRAVSALISEDLQKDLGNANVFLSLYSTINHHGATPDKQYRPDVTELACLKESVNAILPFIPAKYL